MSPEMPPEILFLFSTDTQSSITEQKLTYFDCFGGNIEDIFGKLGQKASVGIFRWFRPKFSIFGPLPLRDDRLARFQAKVS